ncbi:MAG: Flp pilus assembly complex ATPase component TadA, partial [Rubrobacteridae bacterium]|nr:Flp pilus assembly complex ATPase component TadA [Rubrobacteridae bacterium]
MLNRRIGEFLLEAGVISNEQLSEAIATASGGQIKQRLIELGYVTETDIAKNVARQLNINFVDLSDYDVNTKAVGLLTGDQMKRYGVIPIDFEDSRLVIAMIDPTDIFTIDDLHVLTGNEIMPVVASENDLRNAVNKYATTDDIVEEAISSINDDYDVGYGAQKSEEKETEGAPVVKLVNVVIAEAVRERASDIFIEPQEQDIRVRARIDGVLHEIMRAPKRFQAGIISRIKIMSGLDIAERRLPQDGRFGLAIDRRVVDFRVATLPTIHGEQIIIRILEKESISINLDDLGFLPDSLARFKESFTKPYGAILITGPTGSGKTTTLYAVLNILNCKERNIITVEDPVEYRMQSVNQVNVNVKTGLTFAAALRSILRQDPDVVMIGEIRDKETATIAVESALTGHLVISTLHTNNAPSALTRLVEMGIEPFLVTSAVDCVVAQRLARKLCAKCKEIYTPTDAELTEAGFIIGKNAPKEIYRAVGCNQCANTGYRGRIGLYEVMRMTETIERMLVEDASAEDIMV